MSAIKKRRKRKRVHIKKLDKRASIVKIHMEKNTETPPRRCKIVIIKKSKRTYPINRNLINGSGSRRALPPLDFPDDEPPIKKQKIHPSVKISRK